MEYEIKPDREFDRNALLIEPLNNIGQHRRAGGVADQDDVLIRPLLYSAAASLAIDAQNR